MYKSKFTSLSLLVMIVASFVGIEASQQKQKTKKQAQQTKRHSSHKKPAVEQISFEQQENYSKDVTQTNLDPKAEVQASVTEKVEPLADGALLITKTTVEPQPEIGKVQTTTERLIWYAKAAAGAAAGAAAIAGLGYLAANPDKLSQGYDWLMGKSVTENAELERKIAYGKELEADNEKLRREIITKLVNNDNYYQALMDKPADIRTSDEMQYLAQREKLLASKGFGNAVVGSALLAERINQMSPEELSEFSDKYILAGSVGAGLGAFAGGVAGGAVGGKAGAVMGTGVGAVRGVQAFRGGGSPRQVAAKVVLNGLAGTAMGAGIGATTGAGVGAAAGAGLGLGVVAVPDLMQDMQVPQRGADNPINPSLDKLGEQLSKARELLRDKKLYATLETSLPEKNDDTAINTL